MAKRGSAYYGPSSVAAEVAGAVAADLHRIFPLSHVLNGQYGISGAALSLPAVVDSGGISVTLTPELNENDISVLKEGGKYINSVVEGALK